MVRCCGFNVAIKGLTSDRWEGGPMFKAFLTPTTALPVVASTDTLDDFTAFKNWWIEEFHYYVGYSVVCCFSSGITCLLVSLFNWQTRKRDIPAAGPCRCRRLPSRRWGDDWRSVRHTASRRRRRRRMTSSDCQTATTNSHYDLRLPNVNDTGHACTITWYSTGRSRQCSNNIITNQISGAGHSKTRKTPHSMTGYLAAIYIYLNILQFT